MPEKAYRDLLFVTAKDCFVGDLVKVGFNIAFGNSGETLLQHLLTTKQSVMRASVGTKPVETMVEFNFRNRFKRHRDRLLDDLVTQARNAKLADFRLLWESWSDATSCGQEFQLLFPPGVNDLDEREFLDERLFLPARRLANCSISCSCDKAPSRGKLVSPDRKRAVVNELQGQFSVFPTQSLSRRRPQPSVKS